MHPFTEKPDKMAAEILEKRDVKFTSISQIIHEDSLSSIIFRIALVPRGSAILKFSHNSDRYRRETHYLTLLQGVIPVPKIVALIPPEMGFSGAILMEDVEGETLNISTFSDEYAFKMGSILATLHTLRTSHYGDLTKKGTFEKESVSPEDHMRAYFEESCSECSEIVPKELLDLSSAFVHKNLFFLRNVDGPCIVHRDFKPGNAIVRKGEIGAIIDFENTMGSFAEEDFVIMDLLVWSKEPKTRPPFLAGYSAVRSLPDILSTLPLLRLLKAMGALGFTAARGTWKTKHADVFTKNLAFLNNFFRSV